MAATERAPRADGAWQRDVGAAGSLLAAALALPGVLPATAHAQAAPDKGIFQLQYLNYRDWQPGRDRMTVEAPAFYALLPLSDSWVVEGSVVYDAMSGASPLFFNALSGASVGDYRTAGDVKVTKYFGDYSVSAGAFVSSEQDFLSRGGSLSVQLYSEDRNRTWSLGVAGTNDRINAINGVAPNSSRNSVEFLVGVTQALSPNDIVQSNLTYYTGHGYYDDPYKSLDRRPSEREIWAWLTRYNHYFEGPDAKLRVGYRALFDSFGSNMNTFEIAWEQAVRWGITVTPGLRYSSQTAADFYKNPPWPRGFVAGQPYSADTRLASWGAITAGVIVSAALWDGWDVAFRADYYRQDPDWQIFGTGSPDIQVFSARWLQLNLTRQF